MQGTQVDDTLGTGNILFENLEEEESKSLEGKPRVSELPFKFNGAWIDKNNDSTGYITHQKDYCSSITGKNVSQYTAEEFAHLRGKLAYAATTTRPDLAYLNAKLSQVKAFNAGKEDFLMLNRAIKKIKEPRSINIPALDLETIHIVGYCDASFASNADLSSQLGFVVLLKDKNDKACIIHYGSWKCQRVTRSVLGAETFAFAFTLDFCLVFSHDLSSMLGKRIPVLIFTDSKCLFDTITKLSTVAEKRLLIDIATIRESYSTGDLTNVAHILSKFNIADALTREAKDDNLLCNLLETGK